MGGGGGGLHRVRSYRLDSQDWGREIQRRKGFFGHRLGSHRCRNRTFFVCSFFSVFFFQFLSFLIAFLRGAWW